MGVTATGGDGSPVGFRWASDPQLLQPSQQELTPESAMAFLRNITCPTLVLVASDGIYRGMLKVGRRPHGRVGGTGVAVGHAFGRIVAVRLILYWAAMLL